MPILVCTTNTSMRYQKYAQVFQGPAFSVFKNEIATAGCPAGHNVFIGRRLISYIVW